MPNNFITNPGGAGSPGTIPNYVTDPGGSRALPAQQAGSDPVNDRDAAPGGLLPLADAVELPGKEIGVGSIGKPGVPFRLTGG